ncbi:MAG: C39 family peptidase [Candidatus Kapabacteria bacterium]|nr:C39 family peptidase [Candidatus Kapabacteria bacterium]
MKKFYFLFIFLVNTNLLMSTAKILPVPVNVQEQTNWCWVASTKSVIDYYNHFEPLPSQCQIAEVIRHHAPDIYGNIDCCYPNNDCNQTGGFPAIQYLLEIVSKIDCRTSNTVPTFQEIKDYIDSDRPILIQRVCVGENHAYLIIGYDDDYLYHTVTVIDPLEINYQVQFYEIWIQPIFLCKDANAIFIESYKPTAPANLIPNSSGSSLTPTLSWSATDHTDSYEIILADNQQFSNSIYTIDQISTNSIALPQNIVLNQNTTYYWKVRSINNSGKSDWVNATFSTISLTQGLVAYYPFTGGSTHDFSENGNDGTNYGATPTTDRFGNSNCAYSFDGINNYIEMSYNLNNVFTTSVWFITNESKNQNIIGRADDGNEARGFLFQTTPDNKLAFPFGDGLKWAYGVGSSNYTFDIGKWNHALVTRNMNIMKMYINGVLVNLIDIGTTNPVYNRPSYYVGNNYLEYNFWQFKGKIDDIRIYNRALSDAEVQALYHEGEVTIGSQTWTTKNLDVAYYRDGTVIPEIQDQTLWANATDGAWCYYNNDPANGAIYGKLYNWYAVNSPHGLAPTGYHVASDDEWKTMEKYLGMTQAQADAIIPGGRGTDQGGQLKKTGTIEAGNGLWHSPNAGATNSSGFSILPDGWRADDGTMLYLNYYANFWTSTEGDINSAYRRYFFYDNSKIDRDKVAKRNALSVRLVKDGGINQNYSIAYLDQDQNGQNQVFLADENMTNKVQLTYEQNGVGFFNINQDANKISFSNTNGNQWNIFTANINGTSLNQKTCISCEVTDHQKAGGLWSHNGQKMTYGQNEYIGGGHWSLWLMNSDGTNKRQVNSGSAGACNWSNDDNYLFGISSANDYEFNVTKYKASDLNTYEKITNYTLPKHTGSYSDLSVNGNNIYYAVYDNGVWYIKKKNLSTSTETTLTSITIPGDVRWGPSLSISDDENQLLMQKNDGVFIYTVSTGTLNKISSVGSVPRWIRRGIYNTTSTPTLTTTAPTSITSISAYSGGNVTSDGGAAVTARGIVWSTSHNPTLTMNYTVDGSGTGAFTSAITGLMPSTTYYVRAYATNSVGTSYGDEQSFTTIASVQASNISFTQDNSGIITFNWTNGNYDKRLVVMGLNKQVAWTPTNGVEVSSAASTNWPSASELAPGQRLIANGAISNTVTVTNVPSGDVWVRIYEYTGSGSNTVYNVSTAQFNPNQVKKFSLSTIASPQVDGTPFLLNINAVNRAGAPLIQANNLTISVAPSGLPTICSVGAISPASVTMNAPSSFAVAALTWSNGSAGCTNGPAQVKVSADNFMSATSNIFGLIPPEPTVQANMLMLTSPDKNTISMKRVVAGDGLRTLVVAKVNQTPGLVADGYWYLDNTGSGGAFGVPTCLLSDGASYVCANFDRLLPTSAAVNISGFACNTNYYLRMYNFNGTKNPNLATGWKGSPYHPVNYMLASALWNPKNKLTPMCKEAAGYSFEFLGMNLISGKKEVKISWQTAMEAGIIGYELFRADYNENIAPVYNKISSYSANLALKAHNQTKEENYTYIDNDPALEAGKSYIYKLVYLALDGSSYDLAEDIASILTMSIESPATLGISVIAPNPSSRMIEFKMELTKQQEVNIDIVDMAGSQVLTYCNNKNYTSGSYDISMDIEKLTSGTYLLRVIGENETIVNKFVVVR